MTVRAAIVGTGHAARHHLAAAACTPGLQVTAIAARTIERAREFVEAHVPGATPLRIDDLDRAASLDAVIIAVAPAAQPDIAIAAFNARRHVLCEKPLAPTVGEAERIATAWRDSGMVGMVNFCYRLIPAIASFRDQLKSGICGPLQLISAEWVAARRLDPALPHNWKADVESGGGVLQNIGSHLLDYLFCDSPDPHVLAARQETFFHTRPDGAGGVRPANGDETTTALLEITGQCPVFLHLSLVSRRAAGHRLSATGSLGTLTAHTPDPYAPNAEYQLTFATNTCDLRPVDVPDTTTVESLSGQPRMFQRVLARFVSAIEEGRPDAVPGIEAGVQAVRITDALQQASGAVRRS